MKARIIEDPNVVSDINDLFGDLVDSSDYFDDLEFDMEDENAWNQEDSNYLN